MPTPLPPCTRRATPEHVRRHLVLAAARGAPSWLLLAILTAAFLSDVFDGVIARRLGVATAKLRRADSAADMVFYVCASAAAACRSSHLLTEHATLLVFVCALEVVRFIQERAKLSRAPF